MTLEYSTPVETARGLYEKGDSIFEASHRTVEKMASMLTLNEGTKVLDVGAGYGGPARYLAKTYGCNVDCLNVSEVQNRRTRQLNQEQGLTHKIRIIEENFEAISLDDQQ